ncbi:MAG: hypothetical protein AVDCRST_MAG35-461, partial [uncultured Quadrisphaera sp.]
MTGSPIVPTAPAVVPTAAGGTGPGVPTISVAIINRDYGRYLGGALESVLSQTHPAHEVVVVDDGSSDDSREVLAGFAGRVTSILTGRRGKGAATTTAVLACSGDVVALLDADDLALPERLARLAAAYAEQPGAQWVWHGLEHVEREGLRPVPHEPPSGFTPGPHDLRAALSRGRLPMATPATSALSWRAGFLRSLLPLPDAVRSQDNYLKALSMGLAPGYVLGEVLAQQGLHGANAYTTATGRHRRALAAQRGLDLAPALHDAGLTALHRRYAADVAVATAGGLRLTAQDRSVLGGQLRLA